MAGEYKVDLVRKDSAINIHTGQTGTHPAFTDAITGGSDDAKGSKRLSENGTDYRVWHEEYLEEGEEICQQYHVHFPDKTMTCCTYMCFMLFTCCTYQIYDWIAKCCYEHKTCVPPYVKMVRGCMAVTNKHRLLVWKTDNEQTRGGGGVCTSPCVDCFTCAGCACMRIVDFFCSPFNFVMAGAFAYSVFLWVKEYDYAQARHEYGDFYKNPIFVAPPAVLVLWFILHFIIDFVIRLIFQSCCIVLNGCSKPSVDQEGCRASCYDACSAPMDYVSITSVRQYDVANVREITFDTTQKPKVCFDCGSCAEHYEAHLRVFFEHFDHANSIATTMRADSHRTFQSQIANLFMNKVFEISFTDVFGFEESLNWVEIMSEKVDETYKDKENPHFTDAVSGLSDIHKDLIDIVTIHTEPAFLVDTDHIEEKGLIKLKTDVLKDEYLEYGVPDHNKCVTEDEVALIDDFLALGDTTNPAEKVIAAEPSMYIQSCCDYIWQLVPSLGLVWLAAVGCWFFVLEPSEAAKESDDASGERRLRVIEGISVHLSNTEKDNMIVFFGSVIFILLYAISVSHYYFILRPRQKLRPGFILTTSRFIEISTERQKGQSCFGNCLDFCCDICLSCDCSCCPEIRGYKMRSVFPGQVTAGRISKNSRFGALSFLDCKSIECVVSCGEAGAFTFEFDLTRCDKTKVDRRLAFCQAVLMTRNRKLFPQPDEIPGTTLEDYEKKYVGLLQGEMVLAKYSAENHDECCVFDCCNFSLCPCQAYRFACCNNKQSCFPGLPLALSCGRYPMAQRGSMIVTNATIFVLNKHENDPKGLLWCFSRCLKKESFDIFMSPLTAYTGMDVTTNLYGHENFWTRLCFKCCVGDNCCPKHRSTLDLTALSGGCEVGVHDLDMMRSIKTVKNEYEENPLKRFTTSMATVQGLVAADTQSISASKIPVGQQPRGGGRRPSAMAETTNPMTKTPSASYKPSVVGKAKQARAKANAGDPNAAIIEIDAMPSHAL